MATRKKSDDVGQAESQKLADVETEQGYHGVEVDKTPNENYTVEGVLAGKPTPETAGRREADADAPESGG